MNYLNPIFLIPALTGFIFIVIGFIFLKFPPKKINSIIGYRTSNSMKSQEKWDFAQIYSSKQMIMSGIFLTLCSLLSLVINGDEKIGVAIGIGLLILAVGLIFIRTENAIKQNFNS